MSAYGEEKKVKKVHAYVITETNTQTGSISDMIPKFWILQEHLCDIRDDPEVLDPPKRSLACTDL